MYPENKVKSWKPWSCSKVTSRNTAGKPLEIIYYSGAIASGNAVNKMVLTYTENGDVDTISKYTLFCKDWVLITE